MNDHNRVVNSILNSGHLVRSLIVLFIITGPVVQGSALRL